MAAPPRFKAVSLEAIPDAPEWFINFLLVYNESMSQLTNALGGNLTRTENVHGVSKTIVVRTKDSLDATFPITVETGLPGQVSKAWIARVEVAESGTPRPTSGVSMNWRPYNASGRITIDFITGLDAPSRMYRITILCE